jgi:mannose-6-phosphate isomerase-like protein (cupin superfamily)
MKITKYANMREFDNTLRTYYNLQDVRIINVLLHNKNTKELYHTHDTITELLYVIEGNIYVKIKRDNVMEEHIITSNNIITFEPGEVHYVVGDYARVIVFKYIKTNDDLLKTFIDDWRNYEFI